MTPQNPTIFQCTEKDVDDLTAFYDQTTEFLCQTENFPKWTPKVYPSRATVCHAIALGELFAVRDGQKVVGAFVFNHNPDGRYDKANWGVDLDESQYFVIHTFAVAHCYYGSGLASQMVDYCKHYAKLHDAKALRLDVVPTNIPARKLYEKNGFVYVGDVDLDRGYDDIPLFSLYQFVLN